MSKYMNELERIMAMMPDNERKNWERVEHLPVDNTEFWHHDYPCGAYSYKKELHWKNDNWNGHTGMHLMMYLRHEKPDSPLNHDRMVAVLGLCDKNEQPVSNIGIHDRDDLDYWVPQFGRER